MGHLVSGEWEPAALLRGRRRNRKQGCAAHLLPAAAAGCNALAAGTVGGGAQAQLERGGLHWALGRGGEGGPLNS